VGETLVKRRLVLQFLAGIKEQQCRAT
jgi:hypothetical protein